VASRVAGMIPGGPPRCFEWALLRFLAARDRETISGDLFEEYREEQLPRRGALGANYWYLRQLMGFASLRFTGGSQVKQFLILMSVFIAAAGSWLMVMENILRHSGYSQRSAIAAGIVIQGLATLLCIAFDGRAVFRLLISAGAVGTGLLGVWAIRGILGARHFEGFVLLIGLGLVVQSVLTLIVLIRTQYAKST
jgi:hypothetical protein